MSHRRLLLLGVFLLTLSLPVRGQAPTAPPMPASPPLQFIKIIGPKGMRATFYRGSLTPHAFDAPFTIGVRPGYTYRFALSNIPGFPHQTFYPTLEVRGSLILSDRLRNADFPATLVFSNEDFLRAVNNVTIQKAILLERPDNAFPVATSPDDPIEVVLPVNRDLIRGTRHLGVPLVILHMGGRKLEPIEMLNVPGAILLPGERVLPAPTLPPNIPFACPPVFDPVAGPMHPADLIALPDGGDTRLRAGVTRDGKLVGIDSTDTVARYTDSRGTRRIAVSNRVALCVPRYLIARTEFTFGSKLATLGLGTRRSIIGESTVGILMTHETHLHRRTLEALNVKTRPSGISTEVGLAVTATIRGIEENIITRFLAGVDATCPPPLEAQPKDGPLQVIKFPDKCGALVGELITFYIRYTNTGGQPMSAIAIADSLHTRYQYVPGSARTDRAASFSTQPNEAGSEMLRWEIQGELAPGETGIVSFQVRIR